MKLSARPRVSYSPTERAIFDQLRVGERNGVVASGLIKPVYGKSAPYGAQAAISSALRTLAQKIAHNEEPFRLVKTRRNGPHEIVWWLEKGQADAAPREAAG